MKERVESGIDWIKGLIIMALAVPVLFPLLMIRKCLLLMVQLLEVLHLVVLRWVYVPLLDVAGLLARAQPSAPDHYHYHDLKDWLSSKLGVGQLDWKRLEERCEQQDS